MCACVLKHMWGGTTSKILWIHMVVLFPTSPLTSDCVVTLDCTLELWWRICSNSLSLSISFMVSEREDWCGKGGSHTPDNFYVSVWGSKEVRGNTPLSRDHTYTHMSAHICNIRVLLLIFLWEQALMTPVAVTEKIIKGFYRKLQEQASCLDAQLDRLCIWVFHDFVEC